MMMIIQSSFIYRSFDFTNTRIDVALRMYLEAFRLPGESPLISLLMEQFADHWHVSKHWSPVSVGNFIKMWSLHF